MYWMVDALKGKIEKLMMMVANWQSAQYSSQRFLISHEYDPSVYSPIARVYYPFRVTGIFDCRG
jgi:hypothetical protein